MVEPITAATSGDWLSLRRRLWSHYTDEEHRTEIESMLSGAARFGLFIGYSHARTPVGFAEASIRHDYVNGTNRSPVAFVEGVYVEPAFRRKGLARELMGGIVQWARDQRLEELASDADVKNEQSLAMHAALGFQETER